MKKEVAEILEFDYNKLDCLKSSPRGEVWLAKDNATGELVIIKHVKLKGLPYAVIQKSSFRLPAKIFFCDEDEADTVIVEEFISGENLAKRKESLSESEARKILIWLCDGLVELHAQKIIHRDIKPSNLILQFGRIRLIDFDAARIFKSGKEEDTKLLGTKGYAPPEQYGSGQTDARSDIYSLGVTMKNLLGAGYNGRLKKILDKCTEYDPARRFKSVSELKRALRFEKFFYRVKICAAIFLAAWIFITVNRMNDDTTKPPIVAEKISAENSLGGLKLGDSVETVHKIFGAEKEIRASEEFPDNNFYEYNDLVIAVKNNSVTSISTYTDAIKDGRGIRQGDSLEKVIAAYGEEGWTVASDDGAIFYEYPFELADGNSAVRRFAIRNNVVEYIGLRRDN
ncbi:MAG: protein kinase [Quinella sp. 3Q1]|nr:protein kinase [Quinella sp. 3Q1]